MVATLLWKDLLRLRSNWLGLAVLLAMPICITGLLGVVFGPSGSSNQVPKIRIAIVNEDDGILGQFLVSASTSDQAQQNLDVKVLDREAALETIEDNRISAVLIIPEDFSDDYLNGETTSALQLIKNPAESYLPAITEELIRVLVEGLNAAALNLEDELPAIAEIIEEPGMPDMARLARIIAQLGDRLELAEEYLFPPIIGYDEATESSEDENEDSNSGFNIFAFLMPGLVSMFLLFVGELAVRDVIVERKIKTLQRMRTLRPSILDVFVAKSLYATVIVAVASGIMLLGGGWIFGIQWLRPIPVISVTFGYCILSVGMMNLVVAVIYREQLIAILTTVIIMTIGFFGGSMMPVNSLPPLIRESISPWMPNHLFAEQIRDLQYGSDPAGWMPLTIQFIVIGIVLLFIAVALFQHRLKQGAEG